MNILVLGSFMMDQVVSTPYAPKNGETVIGTKFSVHPGGKGANQAVSASRLGGKVMMAGKIGADLYGEQFLQTLKDEAIDTTYIEIDKNYATGVGFVTSEADGNNRIIVVPGANLKYNTNELQIIREIIADIDILIVQLEMDLSVMADAVRLAKENGVTVIFNPAPAQKLSDELLRNIDYLTPNETELEILTHSKINSLDDAITAAHILLDKEVKNIIVTLGGQGSLIVNEEMTKYIKGFEVEVCDTVAAGDAFNGALAVAISEGMEIREAVRFSNAVGALTVTKEGAIPSIPNRTEVEEFIWKLTLEQREEIENYGTN